MPTRLAAAPAAGVARGVELFHALSDETRLAILVMLRDGERCVCDLQDELESAQRRLSFHLKVLQGAARRRTCHGPQGRAVDVLRRRAGADRRGARHRVPSSRFASQV